MIVSSSAPTLLSPLSHTTGNIPLSSTTALASTALTTTAVINTNSSNMIASSSNKVHKNGITGFGLSDFTGTDKMNAIIELLSDPEVFIKVSYCYDFSMCSCTYKNTTIYSIFLSANSSI